MKTESEFNWSYCSVMQIQTRILMAGSNLKDLNQTSAENLNQFYQITSNQFTQSIKFGVLCKNHARLKE